MTCLPLSTLAQALPLADSQCSGRGHRVSPRSPSSSLWRAPAWWPGFPGSSQDSAWPSSLLCSSAGNQPLAKPLKGKDNTITQHNVAQDGIKTGKSQATLIKVSGGWADSQSYLCTCRLHDYAG